ncbi:MAG: transposase [Gammaproteobacteria bacterium]|nr:transposase [Gammaproteobacteria bacterium]
MSAGGTPRPFSNGGGDFPREFVENTLGVNPEISKKSKGTFSIPPMRWVEERTFARLGNYRRLSKDYAILKTTSENMVWIAMLRIMVARCA